MSRNKSLAVVGMFLLVAMVFTNIFWRMFMHGSDDSFDKIKQDAAVNLAKKETTFASSPASATPSTSGDTAKVAGSEASPSADAQNPPPTDTQKTSDSAEKPTDETADWKTYRDDKNKFEFKYPTDGQVVPAVDLLRVSQNGKTWKLRAYDNKNKLDLQAWYGSEFSEKERKNCTLSDSTLKVGSYDAKYVNPNSGETACDKSGYFSISSGKEKIVRIEAGDETVDNINKILKTFKFDN